MNQTLSAAANPAFKILQGYPMDNARNHIGSLIGKEIIVDPVHGRDFESFYRPYGWGPSKDDTFIVLDDNECQTLHNSHIRILEFQDKNGNTYSGNATRFKVKPVSMPGSNTGYQPDQFVADIMRHTRDLCR